MRLENLSVRFGERRLYENFTAEFEDGKITCVMGASGAGKTTLLRALCGDFGVRTDAGAVSYVFQEPRLIGSLTVEKNLLFVVPPEIPKDAARQRVRELAKAFRIDGILGSYPARISGGEASRVNLARAYCRAFDTLLLDEPFRGLDIALKYETQALFKKKWDAAPARAVYVTHDLDDALAVADRIVVLGGEPVEIIADFSLPPQTGLRETGTQELRAELYRVLTGRAKGQPFDLSE